MFFERCLKEKGSPSRLFLEWFWKRKHYYCFSKGWFHQQFQGPFFWWSLTSRVIYIYISLFTFYNNGRSNPRKSPFGKNSCYLFFPKPSMKTIPSIEISWAWIMCSMGSFDGSLNLDLRHFSRWGHWHFAVLFSENWVSSCKKWLVRSDDTFGCSYMAPIGIFGFVNSYRVGFELSALQTVEGWKILFFFPVPK